MNSNPFNPVNSTCSICGSNETSLFIETNAMMHTYNKETYFFFTCNNCDSKFLANPVDEEQLSKYYTQNYLPYRGSHAWGKFSKFVEWDDTKLNKSRKNTVLSYLTKTRDIQLLDVGCGKPDFLFEITKEKHINGVGVDFVAADWDNPKFSHLSLLECDWKNVEFKNKFDVISAWHYLEHDYQLSKTVNRFHELLISGGIIIIEVPMFEGILQKIQRKFWQGWHSPRHLSLFSKKSWSILFPAEDWNILSYKSYGTLSAFTLWWLGYRERRNTDWANSMEPYFWSLVILKIILSPVFLFEKLLPFGIQTVVIQKK